MISVGMMGAFVPRAAASRAGGSLTYGLEAETTGGWCIPRASLAVSGITVASAIYDTLTVLNRDGEYVPYLAKSVDHDATFTRWTITLRPGISFHDGEPLDAAAVKLNLDAARRGTTFGLTFANIADVAVTGPLSLTVTMSTPWVRFDAFLYSDGRLGIAAPAQLNNPDNCASNMIGTGPFQFINGGRWDVNQQLIVIRNPKYWRTDSQGRQLPYLDKITFRPYVDQNQRTNAILGGQVDVTHTSSSTQRAALKSAGAHVVKLMRQTAGRRQVHFYLLNSSAPPFDDLRARKAFALAVDRDELNQIYNQGSFELADGPFDKDVPGYDTDPGFPRLNRDKSRRLVDAYKADHGGTFEVVLGSTNDSETSLEAQLVQEQLAKVGISVSLQVQDQATIISVARSGLFDALVTRGYFGDDPDVQYMFWASGSPFNVGRINDPELQGLLDAGRATADPAQRADIYRRVNARFASQLYNVWVWYVDWTIASKPDVEGLAGPELPGGRGRTAFLGFMPVVGLWLRE